LDTTRPLFFERDLSYSISGLIIISRVLLKLDNSIADNSLIDSFLIDGSLINSSLISLLIKGLDGPIIVLFSYSKQISY
jgi:hypothetical protein